MWSDKWFHLVSTSFAIGFLSLAFLVWSGLSVLTSTISVSVIGLQALCGGYWWNQANRFKSSSFLETFGMGLAIGTFLTMFFGQLLAETGWPGWVVLASLTAVHRVWRTFPHGGKPSTPRRPSGFDNGLSRRGIHEGLAVALVVLLGLVVAAPLVRDHPLKWSGWWKYHQDFQFHEAVASSLNTLGTDTSGWFLGEAVRYHWFVHSWVGGMTESIGLPPFAALTRLTYLVAVVGSALVAWSWAARVTASLWVRATASLLVCCGTYVGAPISIGLNVGSAAPAQAMATVWMLALVLAIIKVIDGELRLGYGLAIVAILSFASTGGKVNHAAVVAGGMTLSALWAFVAARQRLGLRPLWAALATVAGALTGYAYALAGSSGGGLALRFNAAFGEVLGFSDVPIIGVAIGIIGVCLAIGPRWFGLHRLFEAGWRDLDFSLVLGAGVALTGVVLGFTVDQGGRSQDHFLLSASAVMSVITAMAIAQTGHDPGNPSQVGNRRAVLTTVLLGAVGGALSVAVYYGVDRVTSLGWATLVAPAIPWVIAAGSWRLGFLGFRRLRNRGGRWFATIMLASASVVAGLLYPVQILTGPAGSRNAGPSASSDSLSFNVEYLGAGEWVRKNIDESALFVTNRMCSNPAETAPDCSSLWYLASALTRRQFLVEGFGYGVESPLSEIADRVKLSIEATRGPGKASVIEMNSREVGYLWIDLNAPHSSNLGLYFDRIFANKSVEVYAVPKL